MSQNQDNEVPNAPISAEEIIRKLTQKRKEGERPEYCLRGPRTISGKLDLKTAPLRLP